MLPQSILTRSGPGAVLGSPLPADKLNPRFGRLQVIQPFHPIQPKQFLHETCKARTTVLTRGTNLSLIDKITPEYFESDKEQSRKFRKTVFGHEDWFKHRSTFRYLRHISGILSSRIVRALTWPVAFVVADATILVIYQTLYESHSLPDWCIKLSVDSPEPFNLTSFVLSLLLVFRTNASYGRWDNARKIWGAVTNRTRDLMRQGVTWVDHDKEDLIEMLGRWIIAYPKTLKCHLTYESDLEADLKNVLMEEELKMLMQSKHRPNYVARMMAEVIYTAKLTDTESFLMDANITSFADATGGCERIFKTPIPLSWTRHTSRFLMLWLFFPPFIIYKSCHQTTPLVASVISVALLACDEISVTLEEPFGILPLEAMCDGIENNVRDMFRERKECMALVQRQLTPASSNSISDGVPQKIAAGH